MRYNDEGKYIIFRIYEYINIEDNTLQSSLLKNDRNELY